MLLTCFSVISFPLKVFKDLFIVRDRGREVEREGEKHPCMRDTSISCLSHVHSQPGTWSTTQACARLGIKLETCWFTGLHSTRSATPARAFCDLFYVYASVMTSFSPSWTNMGACGLTSVRTLGKAQRMLQNRADLEKTWSQYQWTRSGGGTDQEFLKLWNGGEHRLAAKPRPWNRAWSDRDWGEFQQWVPDGLQGKAVPLGSDWHPWS